MQPEKYCPDNQQVAELDDIDRQLVEENLQIDDD